MGGRGRQTATSLTKQIAETAISTSLRFPARSWNLSGSSLPIWQQWERLRLYHRNITLHYYLLYITAR